MSEKLADLFSNPELEKKSNDLIEQNQAIKNIGSSFLVISKNKSNLIWQKENQLSFNASNDGNRYFSSYNESQVEVIEVLSYKHKENYREPNTYEARRDKPMYVHLAHEFKNGNIFPLEKKADNTFENKIKLGGYDVPIFEDGICDGCVIIESSNLKSSSLQNIINKGVSPAFSNCYSTRLFPASGCFDLINYDVKPGTSMESNFFEGGGGS